MGVEESRGLLRFSGLESARFNCQVYRAFVGTREQLIQLRENLSGKEELGLAIIRLEPQLLADLSLLHDLGGQCIPADVLVHYEREALPLPDCLPSFSVGLAEASDLPSIQMLTQSAFVDYRSHYHANPHLPDFDLCEAYREWNATHLQKGEDAGIFLASEEGQALGFLSWSIEGKKVSIDLNAVHPQHQGKQVYSVLLAKAFEYFHERQLELVMIETQLHNLRVQRVWQRWGFQHTHSFVTVHWMPARP